MESIEIDAGLTTGTAREPETCPQHTGHVGIPRIYTAAVEAARFLTCRRRRSVFPQAEQSKKVH